MHTRRARRLWFDVGIKRYTTYRLDDTIDGKLWFDVGIKRYTTLSVASTVSPALWFDVGIKRYTTTIMRIFIREGCGLM